MNRWLKTANLVMIALFAVSAALQLNDPDPIPWIGIYAAAGLASANLLSRRPRWLAPAAIAVMAAVWSAKIALELAPLGWPASLAASMKAVTPEVELAREMLGLLVVVGWMAVVAVAGRRKIKFLERSAGANA